MATRDTLKKLRSDTQSELAKRDDRISKLERDMAKYVPGVYSTVVPSVGITYANGWTGTGVWAHGQPVTVTKAAGGLGTKDPGDKLYEPFTGGSVGDSVHQIGGVFDYMGDPTNLCTDSYFKTSTSVVRTGMTRSGNYRYGPADQTATPVHPPKNSRLILPTSKGEIYVSFWLRAIKNIVDASKLLRGCKLNTFGGGTGPSFNQGIGGVFGGITTAVDVADGLEKPWLYGADFQARNDAGGHNLNYNPQMYANTVNPAVSGYSTEVQTGFIRMEGFLRLSSPGGATNGGFFWRVQGLQPQTNWITCTDQEGILTYPTNDNAFVTLGANNVNYPLIETIALGTYFDANGADWDLYFSDCLWYFGAGAAKRIEIADSFSTWGQWGPTVRSVSEVQESLLAWNDTSAAFTVNKKSHTSLSGKKVIAVTGPFTAELIGTID